LNKTDVPSGKIASFGIYPKFAAFFCQATFFSRKMLFLTRIFLVSEKKSLRSGGGVQNKAGRVILNKVLFYFLPENKIYGSCLTLN